MTKTYPNPCPCKSCNERKVGCHSNCAKYTDWKKESIEINEMYIDHKRKRKTNLK